MITVTKKQASIALVVVAFATIMIAGSIATSTDNAFAWRNHFGHGHFGHFGSFGNFGPFGFFGSHLRAHTHQSIDQGCIQPSSTLNLPSGNSPLSGNNVPVCVNANLAGNAVSTDQSSN
jgi:hypothetical protein